jgi:two-component system NtrC family sensor kinase
VIVNLVTNAIDAMPRGGRLTLATSSDGASVRVAVKDTGTGIAPAQRERLFMPFHTTKEVGKGTGLGLSVSYGIVKSHGGDILVESRPGEGSTFTVVLPAGPSPPPARVS